MRAYWFVERMGGKLARTRIPDTTKDGSIVSSSSNSFRMVSRSIAELLLGSFSTYMDLCCQEHERLLVYW